MTTRKYHFTRLKPDQFRAALESMRMHEPRFARLTGFNRSKTLRWLNGQEEPPHQLTLLLAYMTKHGPELAEKVYQEWVIREEGSPLPDSTKED